MKDIKELTSDSPSIATTVDMVEAEAKKLGIEVRVEKLTGYAAIAQYGIASPHGIVIDGKVVHAGGLPKSADLTKWLQG